MKEPKTRQIGREIAWTVTFGFILFAISQLWGSNLFWGDMAEWVSDEYIKLHHGIDQPGPNTPHFVYLDIDQEAYQALSYPTIIPRDKLAHVLEKIAAVGPRLILLDIDISWPITSDCTTASDARCPSHIWDGDKEMKEALELLSKKEVPTLLVRQLLTPVDESMPHYVRSTSFDEAVDNSRFLHWVSSDIQPSGDGIVRRVLWWNWGCRAETPVLLPNAALLAAVIHSSGNFKGNGLDVSKTIREETQNISHKLVDLQRNCTRNVSLEKNLLESSELKLSFSINDKTMEFFNHEPNDRIRFSVNWNPKNEVIHITQSIMGTPLIQRVKATNLLLSPDKVSIDDFEGKIVIIGTSSPDQRDLHFTPLGEMPGAFILFNLIRAILEFGPEKELGWLEGLSWSIVIVLITYVCCKLLFFVLVDNYFYRLEWHDRISAQYPTLFPVLIGVITPLFFSSVLFYGVLAVWPSTNPPTIIFVFPFIVGLILAMIEIRSR